MTGLRAAVRRDNREEQMVGTIMPDGFRINPWSIFCLICKTEAARSLDAVLRCAQCGDRYCQNCMTKGEPSLRCANDPADVP
jgi:hypothetical protein